MAENRPSPCSQLDPWQLVVAGYSSVHPDSKRVNYMWLKWTYFLITCIRSQYLQLFLIKNTCTNDLFFPRL